MHSAKGSLHDMAMDLYNGSTMFTIWVNCKTRVPVVALRFGEKPETGRMKLEGVTEVWANNPQDALTKHNYHKKGI